MTGGQIAVAIWMAPVGQAKIGSFRCAAAATLLVSWSAQAAPDTGSPADAPQTLEITGRKLTVQNLVDRKVYAVDQTVQSVTGSAADILDQIPSVEVDSDGNVALRGDPKVTVLLDGKPSAEFAGTNLGLALQQIPASDIVKIEVMTNPPPQYKAEGSAGVINIITRKAQGGGLSGSLQASLGNRRRSVTSATAAYGLGDAHVSVTAGFRQDTKERRTDEARTAADPVSGAPVFTHEAIDELLRRQTPYVKGSFDYSFNDSQSIDISASHRELTGHRVFGQEDESNPVGQPFDALSFRRSDGHEWNMAGSQSAEFRQKFSRPDETVTVRFQRSVTRERERYAYGNDYPLPLPPAPPSFDTLRLGMDLVKIEAGADYVLPVSDDLTFKLGYDHEDDANAFDYGGATIDQSTGNAMVNPAITNDFRYHQQIDAAYGSAQMAINSWTILGGVRIEQTDVHTLQAIGGQADGQSYFRVFPSARLNDDLTARSRLFFNAGRRITRPDPEDLNPLIDSQDIHNLRRGNPALRPEDSWSYEVGYGYDGKRLSYDVTGYYRDSRDAVTIETQVLSADVLLYSKQNLPHSRSGGVEFTSNGEITPTLTFGASGNLFYNEIDAASLGASGLRSTIGVNMKANLDWRPTAEDTAQLSFSRSDRRLTPQGEIGAINLLNIGYRREIAPDLTGVATLSDALNGQTLNRTIQTTALQDSYSRRQMGQILYVGVVYSFGASKKKKGDSFDYDK